MDPARTEPRPQPAVGDGPRRKRPLWKPTVEASTRPDRYATPTFTPPVSPPATGVAAHHPTVTPAPAATTATIRERGRRLDEALNPQTRHTPPPPPPTSFPEQATEGSATTRVVTIEDAHTAVAAAALPDDVAALFERLLNRPVPSQDPGTVPAAGEHGRLPPPEQALNATGPPAHTPAPLAGVK